MKKHKPKAAAKVEKVMHEGKEGKLHSGSKSGPVVEHGSKQEVAIALKEAGLSRKKRHEKKGREIGQALSS